MLSRPLVVVVLSLAAAACGTELGSAEQAIVSCPNWACAQNNATLNNRQFHELAEDGTVNAEGFQLGPLVQNGAAYRVRVSGTRFYGFDSTTGATVTGAGLVGAYFYVIDRERETVTKVYIRGVVNVPVWAGPKKGTLLESYRFEWTDYAADRVFNLCSSPPIEKPQSSELLGQKGEYTMVFEGVRYDAAKKEVLPGDRNWFNFGCAGHVLSKSLLTGFTPLTGSATVAEQQAVLKMLVADYCRNGTPFTVGGEPLYWKSANGYMSFFANPQTLEARWNDKGVVCLGQPRLKQTKSVTAQQLYPDIYAAIADVCPQNLPPDCANLEFEKLDGALAVSANPTGE